MSMLIFKDMICAECGESFDIDAYSTIDSIGDPELKKSLLNQTLFEYTCPHCGALHKYTYPILYHDFDRKKFIFLGNGPSIYKQHVKEQKHLSALSKFVFDNFDSCYETIGTTFERDMISAIRIIEKGLDYKVARLVIQKVTQDWVNNNSDINYQSTSIIGVDLNKKNELEIFVMSGKNGDEEFKMPFPMDLYNTFYKKYKKKLQGTNDFMFSEEQANKFLTEVSGNSPSLDETVTFVSLVDSDDNPLSYPAFVPPYIKVKKSSIVLLNNNNIPTYAFVEKVFKCTRKQCPFDEKINPFVQKVMTEWYLLPEVKPIANNFSLEKLYKLLNDYNKNKNVSEREVREALCNSNVYLQYEVIESMYSETLNINIEDNFNVECSSINGEFNMLSLYLTKNDIINPTYNVVCVPFKQAIKFAIMNNVHMDGIIISANNKLKDDVILHNKQLNKFLSDDIMTNHDKMERLLTVLTKEEIRHMSYNKYGDTYKIIKYFYHNKMSVKVYAKKFKMKHSLVSKMLDYGYEKLINIVQSNYWDFE